MSFVNKVCKMRDFYQSLGNSDEERTQKMGTQIDELLASQDGKPARMKPEDFSLLEIHEAVPPSAFPILTGKVISNKIMQAYTLAPTVHQKLVENMPSKLMIDRIPGATRHGNMKAVNPGGNYQHSGSIEEKWVQAVGQKYGDILDITEEIIMFDQVGLVMRAAATIGEEAAMFKEELCLNGIQDIAGYKSWYPNTTPETATQTDLYQDAQGAGDPHVYDNKIVNILTDIDDLADAMYLLQTMKNDDGKPIIVQPKQLLVPIKLSLLATRLVHGNAIKGQYNHEENPLRGAFEIVTSPFLDAQSTADWYLGDFKRQFIWKEVIPIQVMTRTDAQNDAAWERDIKAQYKIRMYGVLAATDYRYVVYADATS